MMCILHSHAYEYVISVLELPVLDSTGVEFCDVYQAYSCINPLRPETCTLNLSDIHDIMKSKITMVLQWVNLEMLVNFQTVIKTKFHIKCLHVRMFDISTNFEFIFRAYIPISLYRSLHQKLSRHFESLTCQCIQHVLRNGVSSISQNPLREMQCCALLIAMLCRCCMRGYFRPLLS